MRINQVRFHQPYNSAKPKTQKNQKIFSNLKDTVSFKASQPKAPSSPETTIDWALNWDKEKRKAELDAKYEQAVKQMSFWKRNFTSAPEDLKVAYDKVLEKEEISANAIIKNTIILSRDQSENNRVREANKAKEAELEARAQKVSKMEKASNIASAFRISDSGTLDENIAGYEAEKQIIRSAFVDQVAMEKAGLEANVPNSILLHGAIGTGKTTFVKAVAEETDSELVELNINPADFATEVYQQLKAARERYLKEGRRTIIQLNEIEAHISNTILNTNNISLLKSWLDNCAKVPRNNFENRYATTFFFTTNHPLEITDEILYREEKLGKIIALEPAAEGNIEAIIRFYIKKFDKDGSFINPDDIDYETIIQKMNPSDEKGAFGNDKIKKIVELACSDFNQDTDSEKSFEEYLNERIDKAKRNIKPIRLQEYKEQLEDLYED